ncbi:SAM-dependent methyltransferase [Rhizobium wenxiniae]|uniref:Ubiquinone/menaquinone biosynthesis C-methylase UbiE n=2 Tax=Rhizobium/Agrobacterium group TaxID=227290 RepID=A0A7W9YD24_9HYPH|nr:ubiquinone/menaquinone biosynthesis C-methylase UbiE [Rhizobium wenxiniae]GGG21597.1 SAM-dependent methyltransferase [Rhizobium wenxiniae]
MSRQTSSFSAEFNEINQEIVLSGRMRPRSVQEIASVINMVRRSLAESGSTAYVNVKRLTHMNMTAFRCLAEVLKSACEQKPQRMIVVVTSSVIAWSAPLFQTLASTQPNLSVEIYDSAFYPGQTFVEDESFIPILRTQTKMTWRHEREILPRHGLRDGLTIADICCGIGDFATLIKRQFNPTRLVALDHSKKSLEYARRVAAEFGLNSIEYTYGDASQMLLADNQFDFVTCRHSLQIFDRPDVLLRELYRICKPGGRVYITNEKNSHCLGEPHSETIRWTYEQVAKLFSHFDMDVEMGPKSRRLLNDAGFDAIKVESFMVTNLDGDPQDFADVIEAWETVYAGQMAVRRGDTPDFIRRFRQGFKDHVLAALHPKGYAGWPIWAASGRKPY